VSDDVGLPGREAQDAIAVPAHQQGRATRREQAVVAQPMVVTLDGDRVPVEQATHDPHRLFEARHPARRSLERHADLGAFGCGVSGAESELVAAVGEEIQGRGRARDQRRMAQVGVHHERPDPKP
jgi:hypothetical protein